LQNVKAHTLTFSVNFQHKTSVFHDFSPLWIAGCKQLAGIMLTWRYDNL